MKIQTQYQPINTRICFRKQEQNICAAQNPPKTNKTKLIAYSSCVGAAAICGAVVAHKTLPDRYIKQLARDLSVELKEEIKPANLKSVMRKKDFISEIKKLKEQNYVASPENIKNGIFRADLHSHSNFSDGTLSVNEILNQAAEYGDKLQKINGKKFIFALSDHDGTEGVKEALKIIAKNPEKFKNIKFVPAAELSFPIECHPDSSRFKRYGNSVEMAEMLIYNINPFSENSKNYFQHLYNKRKDGIRESIQLANSKLSGYKFSVAEYNKFWRPKDDGRYWGMHMHWNIFHYLNLKTRIADAAKAQNKDADVLFDEIMTYFSKNKISKNGQNLDRYFLNKNIPKSGESYDKRIVDLKYDICPEKKGMLLYAPYQSSFEQIAEFAEKEEAYLAFAHPGFTTQSMKPDSMLEIMRGFVRNSGRLKAAEKFHQAYPLENITKSEIEECNKVLDELGLINIGGRDNHSLNFTKFTA